MHSFIMNYSSLAGGLTCKELMLEDALKLKSIPNSNLQLNTTNTPSIENCLLYQMSDPISECKQTINKFNCWAISCLRDDIPVGSASASIDILHPREDILDYSDTDKDHFVIDRWIQGENYDSNYSKNALKVFKTRQIVQPHSIKLLSKSKIQMINESVSSAAINESVSNVGMEKKFLLDSTLELEYSPQMLELLRESTKNWNVIHMHFQIANPLFRQLVHPLPIGKKLYGLIPESIQTLGDESGTFLVYLLLNDFLDVVERTNVRI